MLHLDNPSNGDVCNDYDLFGKNDDSVLPQSQGLPLTQRMEPWGCTKNITARS